MKKMRKILAVALALAMVMGMTMIASAAESTTITVNNLDANATLTYVQIIQPDQTKETGWAFANGAAESFKKVTGFKDLDDQQILWKLIKFANSSATTPTGTVAATAKDFQDAMKNIETDLASSYRTDNVNNNVITVNQAGVYAVKATTTDTANYAYSPMAAYISFGKYTTVPTQLEPATTEAKKTTIKIEKSNNEDDGVVEINKEVTYTVKTNIPYIPDDITEVKYTITDEISGAAYAVDSKGELTVSVKIGTANAYDEKVKPTSDNGSLSFKLDLSSVAADRKNANKEVVLQYKAVVKSEVVENCVVPGDGKHEFTPATNTLYTGKITMTKYGENENTKLANAKFVIYKEVSDKTYYAIVSKDTAKTDNNEYVLTGWTENMDTAKAENNLIVTDANGEAVVRGLDDSYTYKFKEIVAPEGYSVNTTDQTATWGANQSADNRTGSASMTDTKLLALPGTGGIGTTIFTIAGCAIMIAAAGLFFASRKKEQQ